MRQVSRVDCPDTYAPPEGIILPLLSGDGFALNRLVQNSGPVAPSGPQLFGMWFLSAAQWLQ